MIILPSLEIVPAKYNGNILLSQIPVNGTGDFTVSRALNTATRVNSLGNIELVNADTPRIDYFASGGTVGCPALLVEPSGTNLARWVNQMTAQDIPAASGGMAITTGSTDFLAPDGTSGSITKYVGGAASGVSQYAYYAGGTIAVSASGAHTYSLFVKRGATNPLNFCALAIENYAGGSGTIYSYFNLASGTAITAGASVQNYGNGWYRLSTAPYTLAAGDLTGTLSFFMAEGNGDLSWPASGALNLTAYTWGAQFEAGSVATSYIPTTTGSVTRNADVVSVTGAVSGSIGQTEGTIYLETNKLMDATLERFLSIYSSTSPTNDNISISKTTSNTINFAIRKNNVLSTYAANFSGTVFKFACAFNTASGGVAIYVNGTQLLIDTNSGSFASVLNEVYIGRLRPSVNTDNLYNGRIRAAALYTTRLTDTQLALLTSPYTSYSSMASALSYTLG